MKNIEKQTPQRNKFIDFLLKSGVDVLDLGLTTTPSVQLAIINEKCFGGIMVSASHNPDNWNIAEYLLSDDVISKSDPISNYRLTQEELTWLNAWDYLVTKLNSDILPGFPIWADALISKPINGTRASIKIETKNKTIVIMISGGNIDSELFSKIVK